METTLDNKLLVHWFTGTLEQVHYNCSTSVSTQVQNTSTNNLDAQVEVHTSSGNEL